MSRFRNDSGGVLWVVDLQMSVGPHEEFEWEGHDREVHGLPTGCTWLDEPAKADETKPKGRRRNAAGQEEGE